MKQQALTHTETETLIDLMQRTRMKYLWLERSDLDLLVPQKQLVSEPGRIMINLHTRELHYDIEENRFVQITWLEDNPGIGGANHRHQYYFELFNELNTTLGFDRMIAIIAHALDMRYEALSTGQSEALMKKLIIRARDDGKTLNSTTRSQLQQIKDKITKYQPLVEHIGPFFVDTRLPSYLQKRVGIAPVSVPSMDATMLGEIMSQKTQLSKTPPGLEEEKDDDELTRIREAVINQGLYKDEEIEEEKFHFICAYCDYAKEMNPDIPVTEQQEEHHGRPMSLRVTRTKGSDF